MEGSIYPFVRRIAGVALPRLLSAIVSLGIPVVALRTSAAPGMASAVVGVLAASSVAASFWGASPGWKLLRIGRQEAEGLKPMLHVGVSGIVLGSLLAGLTILIWVLPAWEIGFSVGAAVFAFGLTRTVLYLASEYQRGQGNVARASWMSSGVPSAGMAVAFTVWLVAPGARRPLIFLSLAVLISIASSLAYSIWKRQVGEPSPFRVQTRMHEWLGTSTLALIASAGPLLAPHVLTPSSSDVYMLGDRGATLVVIPQVLINYVVVSQLSAASLDSDSIHKLRTATKRSAVLGASAFVLIGMAMHMLSDGVATPVTVIVGFSQLLGIAAGPCILALLFWGMSREAMWANLIALVVIAVGLFASDSAIELAIFVGTAVVLQNWFAAVALHSKGGAQIWLGSNLRHPG